MTDSVSDADLAWCYDAVPGVSRTFAITVETLDEPMAREVCVGYLVCRIADTVEDDPRIPAETKTDLLRTYGRALDPTSDTDGADFRDAAVRWLPADPGPDWRLVSETPRVLRVFDGLEPAARDCIRPPVRELVAGMASFVERYADRGGLRIRTVAELEEYCGYVAGTVGELVTSLLGLAADPATVARLEATSRAFGLCLQLVNIAKDVGADYREENNVYLPATWLDEAGLVAADVGDPAAADRVAPVVERTADRAAGYLDGAAEWLAAMPECRGNTLAASAIPYLLAVGTIRELKRRPADAVREGVRIDRAEVEAVLARFERGVTAAELPALRRRIRDRPLHEA
jgi:farnesyl-diphosphate farnesyltransferase